MVALVALGAVLTPGIASANTSGDVSFDLDPTNVPSCASAITVPNSAVTASIADTDFTNTRQLDLTDNSYTQGDQSVWTAYFMSNEFDIAWRINDCWGPTPGGWLAEPEEFIVVTKTKTSNSTTSNLSWRVSGTEGSANANQVWISDADTSVKLGAETQWTDMGLLHPFNGTNPASENTYRMRLELALESNYEGYLEDSTYVATATYELWEGMGP